jgi:hypothetical protein
LATKIKSIAGRDFSGVASELTAEVKNNHGLARLVRVLLGDIFVAK